MLALGKPTVIFLLNGGSVDVTPELALRLPPELQAGDAAQELVRRTGKVTRPGRPTLQFHQYEIVRRGGAGSPRSPREPPEAGVVVFHVLGHKVDKRPNKRARTEAASGQADAASLGRSGSSVEGASTSTEEEEDGGSNPPPTTVPVLDMGNGVMKKLMGLGGSGEGDERRQRQRTSGGLPVDVSAAAGEELGWGSNLWHSSLTVATVGTGMYVHSLYSGSTARGGVHGGRELLEETHGLLHDAGGALMDAVTFLDTEFARLYESELFRLSERVLLMAVAMMVVVDMLFDLRRAPTVDRVVTLGLRQTAIRFMFFVRTVVSSCPPKPFSIRPAFPTLVSKWHLGDACCARRRWRGGGWGCGAGSS